MVEGESLSRPADPIRLCLQLWTADGLALPPITRQAAVVGVCEWKAVVCLPQLKVACAETFLRSSRRQRA